MTCPDLSAHIQYLNEKKNDYLFNVVINYIVIHVHVHLFLWQINIRSRNDTQNVLETMQIHNTYVHVVFG